MSAATVRRPVRVTLEGEAYRPTPGVDHVLMVVLPSGHKVCLTEGLGITVEDIAPPRVWTDGDVVQGNSTWSRRQGQWWAIAPSGITMDMDDREIDQDIASGHMRALRYQAGGDQ